MKLYKITWENGSDERAVRWEGTQADAAAVKKRFADQDPILEGVEVPTDKPSLLAWLNANSRGGKEL